jgi:hypothetical protein
MSAPIAVTSGASTWRRPSTWLAVGLFIVSTGMALFASVSVSMADRGALPDRPDAIGALAVGAVFVNLLAVGTILSILRPANPIGWLFLVCGTLFLTGIFATEYVGRADTFGADLPAVELFRWLVRWVEPLALMVALVFIPLLFPDGRPAGRGWRTFGLVAAVLIAITTLNAALLPDPGLEGSPLLSGRLAGIDLEAVAAFIAALLAPIVPVLGLLALASLVDRFRRSNGIERQQLKWFLLAVGVFSITLSIGILTEIEVVWYLILVSWAAVPLSAAIAVLRYRLYDIDRIISRTVGYTIVTVTLAVVFVAVVVGLQEVLTPLTGGNTVAVAASTLLVAALFQPLRRRVQRVVDRRFDRARYDSERTAAAFGARLRDEVDLDRLRSDLLGTAADAVRPDAAAIWLRPTSPEQPG